MKTIAQTGSVRPAPPPPLAQALRLAAVVCALLLAIPPCFAQAPAPGLAVHTYELLPGVVAKILDDGSLLVSTGPTAPPLLSASLAAPVENRRRRGPTVAPFTAVTAEGAPGGQRGFSAQRDDDQDGQVDEDPLDGVDNDGDGLLDEDYAAISEAMVVVDLDGRQAGGENARLEHYHWPYPRLRSSVFVTVARHDDQAAAAGYQLTLAGRGWQEAAAVAVGHTLAGQARTGTVPAFVARLPRHEATPAAGPAPACDPSANLWLAVAVLSDRTGGRPVLDGNRLTLPTGPEPLSLVICAAESWLQLADRLNEAARVQAGVSDQLTGQRAPLIVPPVCARCRSAEIPAFSWQPAPDGGLVLTAHLEAGCRGNLDPDLFRIAGRALGAPAEILWLPQVGQAASMPWSCRSDEHGRRNLDKGHPYEDLAGLGDHLSRGRLQFRFAADASGVDPLFELAAGPLTGATLDGRSFTAEVRPVSMPPADGVHQAGDLLVAAATAAPDSPAAGTNNQAELLKTARHQPTLAPALLEGYPNPFQDVIRLRFVVPATMGEAFVWEENEDPPAGFDPQAAIPWQGGSPLVSVKIYSISGQELVTLFAANQAPGEGSLQWNGADTQGRQVASGTYFCKLQMDDWSVTRRLVYLR